MKLTFDEYFIKILRLAKGMQLLETRSSALSFLLTFLHMEFRWYSKLSFESMMVSNKVSAVPKVTVVPLVDITWRFLELSNKLHFSDELSYEYCRSR